MSGQLVLYVGKTKDVKRREYEHRKENTQCSSRYIPDYMEWTMKVLEKTTDVLGTQREQYFYDTLKPLYNQCRPGQTKKDWYLSDVGKALYKTRNKSEAYKEYQKAYRERTKLNSVQD
jgi:hypothetical protein